MTQRFLRTLTGIGFACSLALLATTAQASPAAGAARARHTARPAHSVASGGSLFHAIWQFVVGDNPFAPKPTQGPTVDPNGYSVH